MTPKNEILNRVKDDTIKLLSSRNAPPVNLYMENNILKTGHVVNAQHQEIPLDRNTLMVFADEAPLFNWGHDCRYLLYSADNGTLYKEVPAQFPPHLVDPPPSFELFHEMVPKPVERVEWPLKLKPVKYRKIPFGNRYAVLFSGASNNRHTNDLEFLYRTLVDLYGFKPENIYVLNYDGTINYSGSPHPVTSWPGDNTPYRMPVHGKGTRTDIDAVIDEIKSRIKMPDLLFIHTNNHGGRSAESYLCVYSGPSYGAQDFADKLATLPKFAHLMVMMEQCFSGGFLSPILAASPATHTSVAAACNETSSSIGGPHFDPFARDWIASMAGHMPNGGALSFDPDANHDSRVSAQEAFDYAKAVKDPYDTPVYNQSSATAGACYLAQRYILLPWFYTSLAEVLKPWEQKLPLDVFYTKIFQELGPGLQELEAEIERRDNSLREEFSPRLQEMVESVMES